MEKYFNKLLKNLLYNVSGSKSDKSILNIYIQSLNTRPNRKTIFKSPNRDDSDVLTASLLM